ncbi:beta-1,4-mannosyltransferase [Sporothrix brasiliensis 5110]|uniref:Chitobiosyldiphosphodolichol beta-mannosyltransferase n=1 Tax=Sporothrix brasiliensis 5110 TaxID=1398154 RepID=A0A0C2IH56_9PEZI|nr:beta-1,4-mannosyltransferase [Sporothrix brasiliensis 5110]KIH86365.1 beta-1,4-mannosyltransferase [Sporothrix brasiliensis 5110]
MALGFSLIGAALLVLTAVMFLAWPRRYRGQAPTVQVLVLGDVGRSPRMQYHALSIAQRGHVQLIGYYESDLLEELDQHPRLTKVQLAPAPVFIRRLPFVIGGPLKVVWQIVNLVITLTYFTRPTRWLLIQNPPSIPTLAVAALVCSLRGTKLLIDWHNYGWSILAGTRGAKHPFVGVSKAYEVTFGRLGDAHLAVTAAMAAQLRKAPYNLPASAPLAVLHDRPAELFQPVESSTPFPPAARGQEVARILAGASDVVVRRLLTNKDAKVLVSSTSWTPDEDFELLLDALVQYVRDVPGDSANGRRPPVLAVITGKGPQKAMYERKLAQLAADGHLPPDQIAVRTAFLPMKDYARLLALADLGVCLHMSSSGVDLPMKVVDMFGAGLPVAAYSDYESFGELVRDGDNGRGFTTSGELADLLGRLLDRRDRAEQQMTELENLRQGARKESVLRWPEEWNRVVVPILEVSEAAASKKTK